MKSKPKYITHVDLFITERCNLKCFYCFHNKAARDMSEETFQNTVKFIEGKIKEGFINPRDLMFNIWGGEPTLKADNILRWVPQLRQHFPYCKFYLSTNGTFFSEDLIKLIKDYGVTTQISYDGVDQEKNRGCNIDENIKKFVEALKPQAVSVRLTFTQHTVKNLLENVKLCHSLGIKLFMHSLVLDKTWTAQDVENYKAAAQQMHDYGQQHPEMKISNLDCMELLNDKNKDNAVCGMGKHLIAIAASGEIYPCHRMVNNPMGKFTIGDVNNNHLDRAGFLDVKIHDCGDCECINDCRPCIAAFYELNGSFGAKIDSYCDVLRFEHRLKQQEYDKLPPEKKITKKTKIEKRYYNILTNVIGVLESVKQTNDVILEKLDAK